MNRIYAAKLYQFAEKITMFFRKHADTISQQIAEEYDLKFFNYWATIYEKAMKHEMPDFAFDNPKYADLLEKALNAFLFKKVGAVSSPQKTEDDEDYEEIMKKLEEDLEEDDVDDLQQPEMESLEDYLEREDADEDFDEEDEESEKKKFTIKRPEGPRKKFEIKTPEESKFQFEYGERSEPKYGEIVTDWKKQIKDFSKGSGRIQVIYPDGSKVTYQPSGNIYKFIIFRVKKILGDKFTSQRVLEIADNVSNRILFGNILVRFGLEREERQPKQEGETRLDRLLRTKHFKGYEPLRPEAHGKKTTPIVTGYIARPVDTETYDYLKKWHRKNLKSLSQPLGGEEGKEMTLESITPGRAEEIAGLTHEQAGAFFENLNKILQSNADIIQAQEILNKPTEDSDSDFITYSKITVGDQELLTEKIQKFLTENPELIRVFFNLKPIITKTGIDEIRTPDQTEIDVKLLNTRIEKFYAGKVERKKEFSLIDKDKLRILAIYKLREVLKKMPAIKWAGEKIVNPTPHELLRFTWGIPNYSLGLSNEAQRLWRTKLVDVLDTVGKTTAKEFRNKIINILVNLRGRVENLPELVKNYIDNAVIMHTKVPDSPATIMSELASLTDQLEGILDSILEKQDIKIVRTYLDNLNQIRTKTNNFEKVHQSLEQFFPASKNQAVNLLYLDQALGQKGVDQNLINTIFSIYKEIQKKAQVLDLLLRKKGIMVAEKEEIKHEAPKQIPKRPVPGEKLKFKIKKKE